MRIVGFYEDLEAITMHEVKTHCEYKKKKIHVKTIVMWGSTRKEAEKGART
jgi:hypothetical protein